MRWRIEDKPGIICRAQALRDRGLSAETAARLVHMSPRFVKMYTHGGVAKAGRPTKLRIYVRSRCAEFFALALSRKRELAVGEEM